MGPPGIGRHLRVDIDLAQLPRHEAARLLRRIAAHLEHTHNREGEGPAHRWAIDDKPPNGRVDRPL